MIRFIVVALLALAGCEPTVTQWDAAVMLADEHCSDDPVGCVVSWCETEVACSAPADMELLDDCLVDMAPTCWALFRGAR